MTRQTVQIALAWFALVANAPLGADEHEFRIRFTKEVCAQPFSGRVVLMFHDSLSEPRKGGWFGMGPLIGFNVTNWQPETEYVVRPHSDPGLFFFPKPYSEWEKKPRTVQAIVRFNPDEPDAVNGAGNGYSEAIHQGPMNELCVGKLITRAEPTASPSVVSVAIRSERLSHFHGRDVFLRATVVLPTSYNEKPNARYPIIYSIPGFGGHVDRVRGPGPNAENGTEFLRVNIDGRCPLGHHACADSDNNGPWGQALVHELLPAIDRQFRTFSSPKTRFLTGHSSGGWSSLWLQVTYPEHFNGTWSTAPDSIDFRDFQQIDLYAANANLYFDAKGGRRPIARRGLEPVLWFRDFDQMERALGAGGQLHSFEAVFGPRQATKTPEFGSHVRLAWSRETGAVDPAVIAHWKRYDIVHILREDWQTLSPKLAGKLHVFMGSQDTFYLEGATKLLKQAMDDLKADATVEIHEGKDHGSLMTELLRTRIRNEMGERFAKVLEADPQLVK